MGYKSQVSYKSRLDLLSRLSCRCFRRLPGAFGDSLVLLATTRCFWRLSGAFGDSPVHSAPGRCIWPLPGAFGDSRATSQFTCFPDAFLRFLELRIGGYQWLMPSQDKLAAIRFIQYSQGCHPRSCQHNPSPSGRAVCVKWPSDHIRLGSDVIRWLLCLHVRTRAGRVVQARRLSMSAGRRGRAHKLSKCVELLLRDYPCNLSYGVIFFNRVM